jgi:hypothetical protein
MTDPKRWSEDGGELGSGELRLLRAGREAAVPRGVKRTVWVALAAQLPSAVAAATTAGAAGTATAGGLTVASLFKAGSLGLLLGATTMTAVTVVERHAAPSRTAGPPKALPSRTSPRATVPARASASARAATPEPAAPLAAPPPEPLAETPAAPSVALPSPERNRAPTEPARAAPPSPPAWPPAPSVASFPEESAHSQHDAESRKVATARGLLRSGQARAALLVLDEARQDFPNGELTQEREALAIESLRVLGNLGEARRRAEAFLARYPESPHAPLARRALEKPAP